MHSDMDIARNTLHTNDTGQDIFHITWRVVGDHASGCGDTGSVTSECDTHRQTCTHSQTTTPPTHRPTTSPHAHTHTPLLSPLPRTTACNHANTSTHVHARKNYVRGNMWHVTLGRVGSCFLINANVFWSEIGGVFFQGVLWPFPARVLVSCDHVC